MYTFNFILAKTQNSIWNDYYDAFIQISGKYKKYLTQRDTPACSKKTYIQLVLDLTKLDIYIGEMISNINCFSTYKGFCRVLYWE